MGGGGKEAAGLATWRVGKGGHLACGNYSSNAQNNAPPGTTSVL